MGVYLSGATAAVGSADNVESCSEPGHLSATHEPASATQATCTLAALPGRRYICKGIHASVAAGATAQTPISVRLRDGATGAGTIKWSMMISAPVNQSAAIYVTDCSIVGSINTAMTLEFSGAGVTASQETVTLEAVSVAG